MTFSGGAWPAGAFRGGAAPAAPDPASSGKSAMRFHSSVPSALTFVSRLARPPAIHARIWSAVTGPYSFPSPPMIVYRSEEHTSELQSLRHLVCRLLLEKKKTQNMQTHTSPS